MIGLSKTSIAERKTGVKLTGDHSCQTRKNINPNYAGRVAELAVTKSRLKLSPEQGTFSFYAKRGYTILQASTELRDLLRIQTDEGWAIEVAPFSDGSDILYAIISPERRVIDHPFLGTHSFLVHGAN